MQRKKKKVYVAVLAALLALLLIFSLVLSVMAPLSAEAVSQSEIDALEAQKQEITDKKEELQQQIDDLAAQQNTYLEQKAVLDEQNELNRQEIELINEQIALYNKLVVAKAQEVKEAKEVEDEQAEKLRVRIRAMEESGSISYISILFQANTFIDLLSRIDFINEIMEYDKWLEDSYIAAREYVQQVKEEYTATLAEKEIKQDELFQKKQELEAQIEDATNMIIALEADIEEYTAAFNENEAAEQALQSDIDKMIAELQAQEAAAAAAAAAAGNSNYSGSAYGTGSYMWPVSSTVVVSSPFGYRIHPIFGTERFHAGIDISAYAGDSIYAADTGYVSIATYSSSYGNYVVINHGNGNTTLYAHMSSIAVSAGDYVTKGQTIGYVGSTGWSTGPHLHFEITAGGVRVDPLNYFTNYILAA